MLSWLSLFHYAACPLPQRSCLLAKALYFAVSSWDIYNRLAPSALCRLERIGIPVLTALRHIYDETAPASGGEEAAMTLSEERITDLWMLGRSNRDSTWKALFDLLRSVNQADLIQQIEECNTQSG